MIDAPLRNNAPFFERLPLLLFSEALPSASSSVTPRSPSVDVYSSLDLAMKPIPALLELGTLPDPLVGDSHPVRGVAQHAPVVDNIPGYAGRMLGDPYSLHFDYFLPGDTTASIPQPRGLSESVSPNRPYRTRK
jgi:hypothetical protein